MTIKNWPAYKENIWDWAILEGCFGDTKIEPTDLDGFVERNGQFLVIETKAPGVEINTGQEITFKRLVQIPQFAVLFVWGKPGEPEKIELWYGSEIYKYPNADLTLLRTIVKRWYARANQQPNRRQP